MIRRHLIIFIGLITCAAGYGAVYLVSTSQVRSLEEGPVPELAWLKDEFNLGEGEFKRICELHEAYLPQCREMCVKIDTQNAKLRTLLSDSTNVTAEADHLLLEAAKLRAECQAMMLKHFFEVSRTMSAAEGRRYLAFVQEKAFHASSGMHATNSPPNR